MNEFLNREIACDCGRTHFVPIQEVKVGRGVLANLGQYLEKHQLGGSGLLVADENTYAAAGREVLRQLQELGQKTATLVFPGADSELVGDESALGELFLEMASQPSFLISVGSGTLTDLTRYAASIAGLPHFVVATAPSMDGYASRVAPLVKRGFKQTMPAVVPTAIYADIDILAQAPERMIQAGFGDLFGKLTAKADWLLSHFYRDEYYCSYVQALVDQAVGVCLHNPEGCTAKDPEFAQSIMEGLVLSGITIAMVGNSRPASGSEHHLSHYWEMRGIREKRKIPLHGEKVGYATTLICRFYELVGERIKASGDETLLKAFRLASAHLPSSTESRKLLKRAGAVADYRAMGFDLSWVTDALLNAKDLRDRYTIMRLASEKGWLPDVVDQIAAEIAK